MNANAAVPTQTAKETYNGVEYDMKLDPQGTVYSIICSSGVKEYQEVEAEKCDKYFDHAECIVENDYPMFSAITVDGSKLYYNAYQIIDGEAKLADSFGISKTSNIKSPGDIFGDSLLGRIISAILSKLNLKSTWKFSGIIIKILAPVMMLFSRFLSTINA